MNKKDKKPELKEPKQPTQLNPSVSFTETVNNAASMLGENNPDATKDALIQYLKLQKAGRGLMAKVKHYEQSIESEGWSMFPIDPSPEGNPQVVVVLKKRKTLKFAIELEKGKMKISQQTRDDIASDIPGIIKEPETLVEKTVILARPFVPPPTMRTKK